MRQYDYNQPSDLTLHTGLPLQPDLSMCTPPNQDLLPPWDWRIRSLQFTQLNATAFLTGSEIYILRTVQYYPSWHHDQSIFYIHTSNNSTNHTMLIIIGASCMHGAWFLICLYSILSIIASYLCHPWLLHYFGVLLKIHSNQTGHLQQLQWITLA